MPIFEYYCEECDKAEDYIVKSSEDTVKCKTCGKQGLEKRFPNKMTFNLKGNWFKTRGRY